MTGIKPHHEVKFYEIFFSYLQQDQISKLVVTFKCSSSTIYQGLRYVIGQIDAISNKKEIEKLRVKYQIKFDHNITNLSEIKFYQLLDYADFFRECAEVARGYVPKKQVKKQEAPKEKKKPAKITRLLENRHLTKNELLDVEKILENIALESSFFIAYINGDKLKDIAAKHRIGNSVISASINSTLRSIKLLDKDNQEISTLLFDVSFGKKLTEHEREYLLKNELIVRRDRFSRIMPNLFDRKSIDIIKGIKIDRDNLMVLVNDVIEKNQRVDTMMEKWAGSAIDKSIKKKKIFISSDDTQIDYSSYNNNIPAFISVTDFDVFATSYTWLNNTEMPLGWELCRILKLSILDVEDHIKKTSMDQVLPAQLFKKLKRKNMESIGEFMEVPGNEMYAQKYINPPEILEILGRLGTYLKKNVSPEK